MSMLLGLGQGLQQAAGTVQDMYRQKESNRRYGLEMDIAERERRDRNNQMGLNQMNADAASMRADQALEIDRAQLGIQQADATDRRNERLRQQLMGSVQAGQQVPESIMPQVNESGLSDLWTQNSEWTPEELTGGIQGPTAAGRIMKDLRTPQERQAQSNEEEDRKIRLLSAQAYQTMANNQGARNGEDRLVKTQRQTTVLSGMLSDIGRKEAQLETMPYTPEGREQYSRLQAEIVQQQRAAAVLRDQILSSMQTPQEAEAIRRALDPRPEDGRLVAPAGITGALDEVP